MVPRDVRARFRCVPVGSRRAPAVPGGLPLTTVVAADGQRGFTLVGLMVAVLIVNIAFAVAASSWVTLDRRAREAETIFRGEQIVRALACFRAAESRPAERLEELVESNCLRHEWGDPMSRGGDWRLLTRQDLADGTVAALLGVADPEGGGGDQGGFAEIGSTFRGALATDGGGPGGPDAGAFGGEESTQRGIVGVTPGVGGPSLRLYNGRGRYEEWVFLAESSPG